MKIGEIFEPGHRKITMTVIAMLGVVLLEKFGGGLSQETRDFILSVLAIFTGGNVLSKGIHAIENVKKAKPLEESEPVFVEEDSPSAPEAQEVPEIKVIKGDIEKIVNFVNKLDKVAGERIQALEEKLAEGKDDDPRFKDLSDRLDVTTQNIGKLINHVQRLGEQVNGTGAEPTKQYRTPNL